MSLNTRSRALRDIQMEGNKFSVTLHGTIRAYIHERFFGRLSASGGRKSHRKRQWTAKSYVSTAKYTQLPVECTRWLLNIFNDHPHIKKNDLVLLLYMLSNVARLNLSPLPRTMFFSNDIRQV